MTQDPAPSRGWYADPDDTTQQRYWNGTSWTDDRRPANGFRRGLAAVGDAILRWLKGLPLGSWLALIGLIILVLISAASTGIGGLFIMAGLVALATGVFSAITGRHSWARIVGRSVATLVAASGLIVMFAGVGIYGAMNPSADADVPTAASTPTPTSRPFGVLDSSPTTPSPTTPIETSPTPTVAPTPSATPTPQPAEEAPVVAAPPPAEPAPVVPVAPPPPATYYANCTEVRNAGAAPLYRDDPGYSTKLDRDGDGVACE